MAPKTASQFARIREEKKTLIMDVALECFAETGFHATTIHQIARSAGISKGLLYNYYEGKEDLLAAIIRRSVSELYAYFDVNRDGYLSPDEFEFFIRRIAHILKEKQGSWRLFFQLIMQKEVQRQFLECYPAVLLTEKPGESRGEALLVRNIEETITGYFLRKAGSAGPAYDPQLELNLFLIMLKGFAITCVFTDMEDGEFDRTVSAIIRMFK